MTVLLLVIVPPQKSSAESISLARMATCNVTQINNKDDNMIRIISRPYVPGKLSVGGQASILDP